MTNLSRAFCFLFPALVLLALCIAAPASAEEPTTKPASDFSKLSPDELLVMCQQLQSRIASLETELAALKGAGSKKTSDTKTEDFGTGGTWVVLVESNSPPDTSSLKELIAAERSHLVGGVSKTESKSVNNSKETYSSTWVSQSIESRLAVARDKYAKMSSEKTKGFLENGKTYDKLKYSESDLTEVKTAVDKLEAERRNSLQKISKAEAQIRDAEQIRIASASLSDGSAVILRSTPDSARIVSEMTVGKKYRISGVQVMSAKILTITVKATTALGE